MPPPSTKLPTFDQDERVARLSTLYQRAGGDAFFEALTRRFYDAVAGDPTLLRVYPAEPERLEAARRHLEWFLIQHWGGPAVYRAERGEGRLAERHRRFAIGQEERDAWVHHMTEAVRAASLGPLDEMQMLSFFQATADNLVNRG
jgi:hemoglobin